jgi:SpoVK/Ycf46/Vps4 family AAA+-type ATPase
MIDLFTGIFAVTNLEKLNWNEGIFESLVMPEKQRSLMYQLIKSHGTQSSGFDDFVKDKGRGLVGLLLGSPGLGKTLTAEAIAEAAHLPLFTISSGYLGQKAAEINQNLHIFLELATRWKAVLLLDEADVFLSKRSTGDLERNSIVSVFLRELEYYTGILILTTNRAHTIDEAFQSKLHLCYHSYQTNIFRPNPFRAPLSQP